MKITKYGHSCLLVETAGATVLFDPGVFSSGAGLITLEALPKLDYLVVTHEHADHFDLPFIAKICEQFPDLTIISTEPVVAQLAGTVMARVITNSDKMCELFTAPHEELPFGKIPANIGVHFAGLLTNPGDSHQLTSSKQVLAMPMTAPWGSMTDAVKKIIELKPQHVIPIHDWHWRPELLAGMYGLIQAELKNDGINFIIPTNGQPIEL